MEIEELRTRLYATGIRITHIANAIGISQPYLSQILHQEKTPRNYKARLEQLVAILDVLEKANKQIDQICKPGLTVE